MRKLIKKMMKRIFAIMANVPAITQKPRIPAINEMRRSIKTNPSILSTSLRPFNPFHTSNIITVGRIGKSELHRRAD